MTSYDWYRIFNLQDFEDTGLVSRSYTVDLEDIGERTILATNGNEIGVLFDDVFLIIGLNGESPVVMDDRAAYLDADGWVHVGVAIAP